MSALPVEVPFARPCLQRAHVARRPRVLTATLCRRIERAWQHDFRDGSLVDLTFALQSVPLLVQCAARVHERREPVGVELFGIDGPSLLGGVERRVVLVGRSQRVVLLFSKTGVLDVAGDLLPLGVAWEAPPFSRDWY